jgi:choline dehydrogenase-like flavoprotein
VISFDHVVVGSGPSGAMAAQTLVEGGRRVLMLDVGHRDPRAYADLVPDLAFTDARRSDPDQHRYFLGDEFEGIPLRQLRAGSTITAPRRYVTDLVADLAPAFGDLQQVESLAYGGLGAAWGLLCFAYSDAELAAAGLDPGAMSAAYVRVAERIGLSGEADDVAPLTHGPIRPTDPALDLDDAAAATLGAYRARRQGLNARGIFVGKPLLALLSRDREGRRATTYHDMDYWSERGRSAYRPAVTLDRLRAGDRFTYQGSCFVTDFARTSAGHIEVRYADLRTRQRASVTATHLVLAAGTLGTTRIVLRSVYPAASARPRVPILSDPYSYVLCVRPGLVGRLTRDARHSVTQLVMAYDPLGDGSRVPIAAFTSYRTMMLFRLIKETPLARADARALLQLLQTGLMVVGIHHPNGPAPERRSLALVPHDGGLTGDALRSDFSLDEDERRRVARDQRAMLAALRALGAYPIRVVDLGHGSSIHYAGTLPFGDPAAHGTTRDSRLNGWDRVWIADGSPFRWLPAKGPTLTLMAHADLVARRVLVSG